MQSLIDGVVNASAFLRSKLQITEDRYAHSGISGTSIPVWSVRIFQQKRDGFFSVDIMIPIPRQAFAYAISWAWQGIRIMSNSSQEAVPYLCTVSSEMSEPIDRSKCTVFPEYAKANPESVILSWNNLPSEENAALLIVILSLLSPTEIGCFYFQRPRAFRWSLRHPWEGQWHEWYFNILYSNVAI